VTLPAWPWRTFGTQDPRGWILDSPEPGARWAVLTGVLDRYEDDPEVVAAHSDLLLDPATSGLVDRIVDWEAGERISGHESPKFLPNLLHLLADMGVRAGDFHRVDAACEQMLRHQDDAGRFLSYFPTGSGEEPAWGVLLCDTHAVIEVLVRFGHGDDPRVRRGLARMAADLADTAQGPAWPCLPGSVNEFRGPGRVHDFCPQVTLEALRTWGRLPEQDRHADLLASARVALAAWQHRAEHKPYQFGHGLAFRTVKWPPTWYRALELLDTLGRFPALWRGQDARQVDRVALAELLACLVTANLDDAGRVVPRSTYRGFEGYLFGQKKEPSAFATAVVLRVLHRLDDLAPEARAVDIEALWDHAAGRRGGQ